MEGWLPGREALVSSEALSDDARFNEAALQLFALQFATNEPYGHYCRRLARTPAEVRHWTEIPAVPTDAYKSEPLATFDSAAAVRVFMTSGTSAGPESRRKVYKDAAAMKGHDAVVRDGFRAWC